MNVPGSPTSARYSVTLHVPTALNGGSPVPEFYFQEVVEAYFLSRFGAYNMQESRGGWMDPADGTTYHDPKRLYTVHVANESDINGIRYLADELRGELEQVCVYVTVSPITAYLV